MSDTPYSLSDLNFAVRNAVQSALPGTHQLVAEISELRESRGHAYLELIEKDSSGKVLAKSRATIWGSVFRMLTPYFRSETGHDLHAGLKVLITVSVEFHEIYGYSLNIRDIDPAYTLGDIEKRRREIINQLEEEGIMGMNGEIEMPDIPQRIAVISSATAAGFGDFADQLENNLAGYRFHITLFEATMQGENTDASVINAFDQIYNQLNDFDLVVLIRGGGSRADLSAFDSYFIAANICQFPLPVLVGIGHERDESIADLVAHTAVKTPTAAAEFLISKFAATDDQLTDMQNWLISKSQEIVNDNKRNLQDMAASLRPCVKDILVDEKSYIARMSLLLRPACLKLVSERSRRIEIVSNRISESTNNKLVREQINITQRSARLKSIGTNIFKNQLQNTETLLNKLQFVTAQKLIKQQHKAEMITEKIQSQDPEKLLRKGYSITQLNGKIVKSISDLNKGEVIETVFIDGSIKSKIQ